jgi:hypothetical protein
MQRRDSLWLEFEATEALGGSQVYGLNRAPPNSSLTNLTTYKPCQPLAKNQGHPRKEATPFQKPSDHAWNLSVIH